MKRPGKAIIRHSPYLSAAPSHLVGTDKPSPYLFNCGTLLSICCDGYSVSISRTVLSGLRVPEAAPSGLGNAFWCVVVLFVF